MEVCFSVEVEAELKRAALERGRAADQLVQEIVEAYLDHDKWFRAEVQKGLAQLDNGESVSHDEVVARIERMACSDRLDFKEKDSDTILKD
jgi:predicted transcriptional regulator